MTPAASSSGASLRTRLAELGRELAERETPHRDALAEAREHALLLREEVARALDAFHDAVEKAGAAQLRVALGPVRWDDKHVRSVQFDLTRGRHRALVTVKSRGEVTLVGPFKAGRDEGPCKTFPLPHSGSGGEDADPGAELRRALGDFLERFLQQAATP